MSSSSPFARHRLPLLLGATLAAQMLSAATPSTSSACGGFFCSAQTPVNQAAERIIFAQDGDVTTQIVEILYEGPAEKFAWVLPVPGSPDISVSSGMVFQRLQAATNPSYRLNNVFPSDCGTSNDGGALSVGSIAAGGTSSADDAEAPRITVVGEGSVGPFNYQTISVDAADEDPAAAAVRWLEDNEYDIDNVGADVLRPYLENGLNLLAVKLQKGISSGAIQPLSLTFQGSRPSIPIRPTAVAANEDMGVLVWVLGSSRAVPTNYNGLELNELLIDWTNPGANYDLVVSRAADEAEGQGFVTELAGQAAPYHDSIDPGSETIDRDSYLGVKIADIITSLSSRFGSYDGFLRILSQHVAFRDQLTAEDFVACPDCYVNPENYASSYTPADYGESYDEETDPINETDISALITAIEEDVLGPIFEAADLFQEFDYVTRLYTTMSASEMTMDPIFDFNPDLEDVSNTHVADRVYECDLNAWTATLPDGREVSGVGSNWPFAAVEGEQQDTPFAARILSFDTSGPATVVADNRDLMESTPSGEMGVGGTSGTDSEATGGEATGGPTTEGDSVSAGGLCSVSLARMVRANAPLLWVMMAMGAGGLLRRRSRRLSVKGR